TSADASLPFATAFRSALAEAGYVEGQNLEIAYRWAEGDYTRLPGLAGELVKRKVEVIAASGGDRSTVAAKAATSTIPLASVIGGDPVAAGFVASLARPGGNLTGVSLVTVQLMPKRLELLRRVVPQAKRVALLVNGANPQTDSVIKAMQAAARAQGVALQLLEGNSEATIDTAFVGLAHSPVDGLVRDQLVVLTAR